ncbi:MAG: DUF885 domain-containing protein [Actinomycetota bacterium]
MNELSQLADDYWELAMAYSPTTATLLGDRRFDHRLDDIGDEAAETYSRALSEIVARTQAIDPSTLDTQDQITRSMLISEGRNQLTAIETGVLFVPCDPNLGPLAGLLMTIGQIAANNPEQAGALTERYRQVPRYLEQAADRHQSETAKGRTPIAGNVNRVLGQIDSYLASPLEWDPVANLTGPTDWPGLDTWHGELATVVEREIRPAFARYRESVESLLAVARDEEHAGLCHLNGGLEIYERLIEVFTSLPVTAAELHEFGNSEAKGKLAEEFQALGVRAFGEGKLSSVLDRLRTDPALRYSTADEIVADAERLVEKAWLVAPDWFNLRPTTNCTVVPVPEALAESAPPAYYFPPAMDGSRPGTYFINLHNPTERVRYAAEAVAYHEANPGHHFQLTLGQELTDIPTFRKNAITTAYAEGWGLYSERLADEMDLYSSDIDRLGMVSAEAWRAGRLVVDTGIHAFGWTRAQAVAYFQEWSAIDQPTIETEVDRYIGVPGQALAYKVGQREILRLRDEAMDRLGDRFNIKGFHDAVLGSGSVTLPILRELVEAWVKAC